MPNQPWDAVSMDFFGITKKPERDDSIYVVVDRLYNMTHFTACMKTSDAPHIAIFATHIAII